MEMSINNVKHVVSNGMETTIVSTFVQQQIEGEVSLFTMSDKQITDLIYATHVHADKSFDEDSLFVIVENILKRATQIIDNVVQGSNFHFEYIEDRTPKSNLSVPLCTLRLIGRELSCKAPGEKIAHETTLAILHKLSTYTWEAKAVLTLAAFALEFGDICLLAQLFPSDPLANQLATLKRVPVLVKPTQLQKRRQALLELTSLIKTTMEVIAIFDEFEKLSLYDSKDIPGLSMALDHMPVDVYWAILTIAACATKVTILMSDEPDKPHDLSYYAQKINYILNRLTVRLTVCRRELAEAEAHRRLIKLLGSPTEVMEVFKALIFTKDFDVQPIIDGSTNRMVNIEVLRRKNIFMFMSSLDITDNDISILKPVYDTISEKEKSYKIVWIPIVEQWTEELLKKYDRLRSEMPWYILHINLFSAPIAGIRFIKDKWQYKGNPILVLMNPQGRVENLNAFHLIHVWGLRAFPYDKEAHEKISREIHWIGPIVKTIHPIIESWVREEKYIFFYGGKSNDLIQQFTKKVTALTNSPLIKDSKINIELFFVGGEDYGILWKFWNGIENLFFTKANKQIDPVTQEIQRLLSYKNESAWAVVSKGSAVVTVGHGSSILSVVEEFDEWKGLIKEKGFEIAFKEYYKKVITDSSVPPAGCHLEVPSMVGQPPMSMQCPECLRNMKTYFSYKCRHNDDPMNAYHY